MSPRITNASAEEELVSSDPQSTAEAESMSFKRHVTGESLLCGALDSYQPQGHDNSLILLLTALGISLSSLWKVTGMPVALQIAFKSSSLLPLSIPFEVEPLLLGCVSMGAAACIIQGFVGGGEVVLKRPQDPVLGWLISLRTGKSVV